MPKVFISYRRSDRAGHAGWLRECLQKDLSVMMDITAIELGDNFQETIRRLLYSADVALVLIGPRWATARDEDGALRLSQPHDYVRLEVLELLRRDNILVIPTLVWGATMPRAEDVSEELRDLLSRQAMVLTDKTWKEDVERLKKVLTARTFKIPPVNDDKTMSLVHLRQLLREAPPEAHSDRRSQYVDSKFIAAGEAAQISFLSAFGVTLAVSMIDWVAGLGLFDLSDRWSEFAFQVLLFLGLSVVSFAVVSGRWWWQSVQRRRRASLMGQQ